MRLYVIPDFIAQYYITDAVWLYREEAGYNRRSLLFLVIHSGFKSIVYKCPLECLYVQMYVRF